MTQQSKAGRVVKAVFRYLTLTLLVVAFAVVAPLWGLADNLVKGLTDQRTYEKIIREAGIGSLVAEGMYKVETLLPASAMTYLQGSEAARSALDELNGMLAQSVDEAVVGIVGQVPAYVAGEKDSIEGAVDLRSFKQAAVQMVATRVPGGILLQGMVRRGVESSVPDTMPLDKPLIALEALLTPVRLAVGRLMWLVDTAGVGALNILVWIAVIAFALSRSVRWCGIALAAAGVVGLLLDGILQWILGLVLPDAVLDNQFFRSLLYDAVTRFGTTAEALTYIGASAFVLSIVFPPVLRVIGRRTGPGLLRTMITAMRPRGGHATILTAIALVPALISSAVGGKSFARRAVESSLGGYHMASRAFDFALPALILWSVGVGRGAGILGSIAAVVISGFLVLFWFLRDRPSTLGGFNFVDRIADIRRGRQPGRRAPAASLVRSLPLVGALSTCVALSPWIAFGAAATVEVISIAILWPDRSLFDLLAGTRARRISRS